MSLIVDPGRTIEVARFMRFSLLTNTDRLLLMVRRRVADLWRRASKDANRVLIHWADLYRELLASRGQHRVIRLEFEHPAENIRVQ